MWTENTCTSTDFYTKITDFADIILNLYKYKEKLVILQLIGIIVIKIKETRMITYTCRYSSVHLIPNSSWQDWIIGIKCPLEYLQL